jgi:hypothetical protein
MGKSYYKSTFVQRAMQLLGILLSSISILDIIYIKLISFLYRDSLFSIIKQLDPVRLKRCTRDLNQKKGEYIVPSLDFI